MTKKKQNYNSTNENIEIAVEKLYREFYLRKANKEYEKLKKDKKTWSEEQEEQALWETTNLDGLEDE